MVRLASTPDEHRMTEESGPYGLGRLRGTGTACHGVVEGAVSSVPSFPVAVERTWTECLAPAKVRLELSRSLPSTATARSHACCRCGGLETRTLAVEH